MALSRWQKFALEKRVDRDVDETGDDSQRPGGGTGLSETIPYRILHRRIPVLLIDWISEIELGLRLLDQTRGERFSPPEHLVQAAKRRDCPKSRIRLSPEADDLHKRLTDATGYSSAYILVCALSAAANSPLTKARDQLNGHAANHNTELLPNADPLPSVILPQVVEHGGHREGKLHETHPEQAEPGEPEPGGDFRSSEVSESGIRSMTLPYFVTSSPSLYPDFETVSPFEAFRAFNACPPDTLLAHMDSIHTALQSPETAPDERTLLKAAADQAKAAYRV